MRNAKKLFSALPFVTQGALTRPTTIHPWLDPIVFPTLLIVILLSLVRRSANRRAKSSGSAHGYIFQADVHHARFLPIQSRHQFRYTTLYYAVELTALETGRIDGRLAFSWRGMLNQGRDGRRLSSKRTITAIKPANYLRLNFPDLVASRPSATRADRIRTVESSILLKLAYELRDQGFLPIGPQDEDAPLDSWREHIGQVWAVTMPSYFGFNGINPLTVYYMYRPTPGSSAERGSLWLVVLEVHNTFSERHVYILQTGAKEDPQNQLRIGYDHQWTFPRSFHVSPFNDRGGYYRLFIRDLFRGGPHIGPDLDIRLLLLIRPEGESTGTNSAAGPASLRKKLLATLACHPNTSGGAEPLCTTNLLFALAKQPFSLFLTFPRILYEAGKLHFRYRLDAFGRPDMQEPLSASSAAPRATEWNGVGWPPSLNPVEQHRGAVASNIRTETLKGGILWPEASGAEKACKARVLAFVQKRVQLDPSLSIRVVSADPSEPPILVAGSSSTAEREDQLTISIRSFAFYTDMLLWPDAETALLVGSITARRWGVNDQGAFKRFFRSLTPGGALSAAAAGQTKASASQRVRQRFWKWALGCANHLSERQRAAFEARVQQNKQHCWTLWQIMLASKAEKWVFEKVGARYVLGTEPWLELGRALLLQSESQGEGKGVGPLCGSDSDVPLQPAASLSEQAPHSFPCTDVLFASTKAMS
ncbi:hypothetical protein K437DRAFT_249268 [Tilletiaria anomala UBC 951]|uniref:DUF1365-domain-containing protein n=1 Tax=Tilletiaria anomala (strain ATCC 24038 / CBS 436.72 / UBC 951) TaxID=1037660 RepID=A0A066VJS9_TILAU|nr:uncharacterized protein K437DRAFT_249268 [Tilletiaria anomala UBC 951]KDN41982.1 hypothetical protein K437DRAFT_249268 [Tilletiaria anomala UBC 951]